MIKHLLQQVLKKCTSIEFFYFSFLKALEWVHVYMIFISKRKRNVGFSKYQRAIRRAFGTPVSQFTRKDRARSC